MKVILRKTKFKIRKKGEGLEIHLKEETPKMTDIKREWWWMSMFVKIRTMIDCVTDITRCDYHRSFPWSIKSRYENVGISIVRNLF